NWARPTCVAASSLLQPRNLHHSLVHLFFFSSRRRHTRLQGDWSSDVCSSDLRRLLHQLLGLELRLLVGVAQALADVELVLGDHRSEERRVGKECRSGWARQHEKKKQLRQ